MDAATLQKKVWQQPTLVEYGDVAQITRDDKTLGWGDAYILTIGPITISVPVPVRHAS